MEDTVNKLYSKRFGVSIMLSISIYYAVLNYYLIVNEFGINVVGKSSFSINSFIIYLTMALATCIPIVAARGRTTSPSSWFYIFQLCFVFLPSYAFLSTHNSISPYFVIVTSAILLYIFSLTKLLTGIKLFQPNKVFSLIVFIPVILVGLYSLVTILSAILLGKISIEHLTDIEILYTYRETVFSGYSVSEFISIYAMGYFFIPLGAIYAIERKRQNLFVPLLVGSILLYAMVGMKTYIAIMIFTAIIYKLSKSNNAVYSFTKLLIGISIFVFLTDIYGIFIDSPWPNAIIFDRGLMTPGQLHVIYGEYFEHKDALPFWQIFNTDKAGIGTAEDVMLNVFGGTIGRGEGANAGFLATAFARYGWVGVILHSSIIAFILYFLDNYAVKQRSGWLAYSCIPSFFLLTNADLPGVIMYFGLALVIASISFSINFYKYSNAQ